MSSVAPTMEFKGLESPEDLDEELANEYALPRGNQSNKTPVKLDSKSLGAIINFKQSLEKNLDGAKINGGMLQSPNEPFENKRKTDSAL